MSDDQEIKFDGPPPEDRIGHTQLGAVRQALDAHPGEWGSFECVTSQKAAQKSYYLRRRGYEAVARGKTVYARKVEA
jgi:hypothetical protein